jgi:hypothetical protein
MNNKESDTIQKSSETTETETLGQSKFHLKTE